LPEALQVLKAATLKRLECDLGELIGILDPDQRGAHIPLGRREQ
jgi:hypothetical protein